MKYKQNKCVSNVAWLDAEAEIVGRKKTMLSLAKLSALASDEPDERVESSLKILNRYSLPSIKGLITVSYISIIKNSTLISCKKIKL